MLDLQNVAETAAELAQTFRDHAGYDAWFERHKDALGGRAGLASIVSSLSQQLERVVGNGFHEEKYDWYITCDAVAEKVISSDLTDLTDDQMRECLSTFDSVPSTAAKPSPVPEPIIIEQPDEHGGPGYTFRISFGGYGPAIEVKDAEGEWRPICAADWFNQKLSVVLYSPNDDESVAFARYEGDALVLIESEANVWPTPWSHDFPRSEANSYGVRCNECGHWETACTCE